MASTLESIHTFIKTCPHIDERLNVLKIDKHPTNYSIDPIGNEYTVVEDVIGNQVKALQFYISAMFKSDTRQQEFDVAAFFENVMDWIETQNNNCNFPTSNGVELRIDNRNEVFSKDPALSTGIYQIIVTYEYKKEG